jgi:hypothetical protein
VWQLKVFNRTGFIAPFALRIVFGLYSLTCFFVFGVGEQECYLGLFDPFCLLFYFPECLWWSKQQGGLGSHFARRIQMSIGRRGRDDKEVHGWRLRNDWNPVHLPLIFGFSLMMRYVKACLICFISTFTDCFSVKLVDRYRGKKGHERQWMVVNVGIYSRTVAVVWTTKEGEKGNRPWAGWGSVKLSQIQLIAFSLILCPSEERRALRGLLVALTLGSPSLFQYAQVLSFSLDTKKTPTIYPWFLFLDAFFLLPLTCPLLALPRDKPC